MARKLRREESEIEMLRKENRELTQKLRDSEKARKAAEATVARLQKECDRYKAQLTKSLKKK